MTHTNTRDADATLAGYSDLEIMRHLANRIPGLGELRRYLASVNADDLTVHDKRRILDTIECAMTRSD